MSERIDDGGRRAVNRHLPDAFRAERPVFVWPLENLDRHRRRIERRRDDVVGQLGVGHPAVAHDDLFEQGIAEPLRRPAFDLPCRQHRMNRAADLVHRGERDRRGLVCDRIDLDLDNVASPAVAAVASPRYASSSHSSPGGFWYCLVTISRRAFSSTRKASSARAVRACPRHSAAASGRQSCTCARRRWDRYRAPSPCRQRSRPPDRPECPACRRRSARASSECPDRSPFCPLESALRARSGPGRPSRPA